MEFLNVTDSLVEYLETHCQAKHCSETVFKRNGWTANTRSPETAGIISYKPEGKNPTTIYYRKRMCGGHALPLPRSQGTVLRSPVRNETCRNKEHTATARTHIHLDPVKGAQLKLYCLETKSAASCLTVLRREN